MYKLIIKMYCIEGILIHYSIVIESSIYQNIFYERNHHMLMF